MSTAFLPPRQGAEGMDIALPTLAYHVRSKVIDLCETKCWLDTIQGRKELGEAFGAELEPCVKSGKACLACVAEAERAG